MAEVNKGILKKRISKPILSIVIPHHGGFDILNSCLESLERSTFKNFETIIVDNNSTDNSISRIKNNFPQINVVSLEKNLGYAGGCNQGALESKGQFLLFLNNDTVHEPDWIEHLVALMKSDHTIGSIQPKVLNIKNKNLFDYAGGSGGFIDILCFPFTRGRIFDNIELDEGQYNDQLEIFWASGCAFITRKEIFLKVLFDSKLFAYMEEIDYSWKTILMGYKNLVEPKSVIYHDGGELKSRNFIKSYLNHRNSMILFITNHNCIVMIFLLIAKLILEMASLVKYIVSLNISGFIAQICSYFWILLNPLHMIRRIIKINQVKKYPLDSIVIKMFKPSIVVKYYILGKKKYKDLIS